MNKIPDLLTNNPHKDKFPELVAYSVTGADYKRKSKKMFPHGLEAVYQVLGDTDKFVSIVYYCGKRGYRFNFKEIEIGGIKGFRLNVALRTKRQFTYFKKRFG